MHRENERQERESQRAKNEVERLKQEVAAGGGGASSKDGSGSFPHPPWKKKITGAGSAATQTPRPVSVEERKRQMAQLAEMGVAIPEEYRGELALAGEWQTLSEKVIENAEDGDQGKVGSARSAVAMGVRKRKREPGHGDGDDDEREEDDDEGQSDPGRFVSKGWGSRMRQYPGVQDDGDADLDALLASTKDIKKAKPLDEETIEDSTAAVPAELPAKDVASLPVEAGSIEEAHEAEATPGIVFKKRKPKIIRK